jgi:hypothetical protein
LLYQIKFLNVFILYLTLTSIINQSVTPMSGKRIYYPLVLLLMFLLSTIPTYAQHFELINSNKVKIPFKMIRNMVIIKLYINDRGPYNFILDTGVGIMIITEPKLVDSLNLANKRTLRLAGLGAGEDMKHM